MTGQVWAYARVSTRDQNPQLQLDALEASGYDTLVQEKESAKRGVLRPGLAGTAAAPAARRHAEVLEVRPVGPQRRRRAGHRQPAARPQRQGGVADRELRPGHQGRPAHVRRPGPGRRVRARTARRAPGRRNSRGPAPPGRGADAARQEAHRPPPCHRPRRARRPPGPHQPAASPSPKPPASSRSDAPPPTPPSPPPDCPGARTGTAMSALAGAGREVLTRRRPVSTQTSSMNRTNGERRSPPRELVGCGRRSVEPRQRLLRRAALLAWP